MRTLVRFVLHIAFLVGTLGTIGCATTLKAYQQASHNAQIGILIAIGVGMFALAWVVLSKVIPAKKKTAARTSYPYATATAKRR